MSSVRSGLAPIVFFGYNRGEHATWALESIKACAECDDTPITIYMDGPKDEAGVEAVEAARAAVRRAAPNHARIILRDENLGLANSIRAGVSEACEDHGRVIVIEDDLVLSRSALSYFNRALKTYETDERVMHVAGFWPEPTPDLPSTFFLRWPSVWGWATWARAWTHLEWDPVLLKRLIQERDLIDRFNEGGWDFYGQLIGTLEGRYDSWGIRWYASVLLNDGLALHPRRSLVRNTGTDGSGVHGDESTAFGVSLADEVPFFPDRVTESTEAVAAWGHFVARAHRVPLASRLASALRRISRRGMRTAASLLPAGIQAWMRHHWHNVRIRRVYGAASWTASLSSYARTIRRPRRTLLLYPQLPIHHHVDFKACALLGYGMTADPNRKFDVAFKGPGAKSPDLDRLSAIHVGCSRIVNRRSGDMGTQRMDRVFEELFGYSTGVDPTTYAGPMVEKSDESARHDARIIIEGPIAPGSVRSDAVYQLLLEHRAPEEELVIDMRVPVYDGHVPLVYVKYRTLDRRFGPGCVRVELADPRLIFSEDELASLARFAHAMGLDYGEIDVIRHEGERLYVVDANNAPAGPPESLSLADRRKAMSILSAAFEQLVETWSHTTSASEPRPVAVE